MHTIHTHITEQQAMNFTYTKCRDVFIIYFVITEMIDTKSLEKFELFSVKGI